MKQSLSKAYEMKRRKKMAEGGMSSGGGTSGGLVDRAMRKLSGSSDEEVYPAMEEGEDHVPASMPADSPSEEESEELNHPGHSHHKMDKTILHDERLNKDIPKSYMASKGGLVGRVMAKMMSEGGMVANQEHHEMADTKKAEFDDLVLEDHLDGSDMETGEAAGDHLGDIAEERDRKDIVSKIMHSLKKRDRNPRPA